MINIEKKNYLQGLLGSFCHWSRTRPVIDKNGNIFLFPEHQLVENLIIVLGFCERTKKCKTKIFRGFQNFLINSAKYV